MEEKIRFVVEYEQDNYTMSELCRRYGIARDSMEEARCGAESGVVGRAGGLVASG